MEKLTQKIEKILKEDSAILALSKVTIPRVSKELASGERDRAIAFAIWLVESGHQILAVNGKTKDFLFSDFISNYYK